MRIPIVVAVFCLACSPAQREWRMAKRADTSQAYRSFAQANPTDPHRAEALERTEQLDWQHAVARNSPDAWGNYVAFHPGSARIGEARANLEAARWKAAGEEGSRQAYDLYLGSHPNGPHSDEARAKLDEIAWREADREGTIEAYSKYLVRYRNGPHAAEAIDKRQNLFWKRAVETDNPIDYRVYLTKFPDGAHADDAKSAIEGFRFSGVAVKLVVKSTYRGDSLRTWKSELSQSLGKGLREKGFEVAWLDVVDGRGRAVDPFSELLLQAPEDHATLVIVLEESRGRAFDPAGYATDVDSTVYVVPPARVQPFIEKKVDASTSARVRVQNEQGLHLDAQEQLGYEILRARLGLEEWKR